MDLLFYEIDVDDVKRLQMYDVDKIIFFLIFFLFIIFIFSFMQTVETDQTKQGTLFFFFNLILHFLSRSLTCRTLQSLSLASLPNPISENFPQIQVGVLVLVLVEEQCQPLVRFLNEIEVNWRLD